MNKTKQKQNNEASKTYVDLHIWRLDSKTQSEDCVFVPCNRHQNCFDKSLKLVFLILKI